MTFLFVYLARQLRGSNINSNIFNENTLFNQQKLGKSSKIVKKTEHLKSKQQKSFIPLNTLTTLLIFQTFSNPLRPALILCQPCHQFLNFYYSNC